MKHEGKPNQITQTVLIFCMATLLISGVKSHYPPWGPTRHWFEFTDIASFFLLLVHFLYDWVRMWRYCQNEGAEASRQIRREQILWCMFALILYVGFLIWIITNFLSE